MPKVQFIFNDRRPTLKDRNKLKSFIELIFKREKKGLESISYIFCSDEYLLGINKQFLNHDFYTDVITFDLSSPSTDCTAEVYLSVDRIKENAIKLNVSLTDELHRVVFHGVLHLCGYKDKKKADVLLMRQKEDEYLKAYFK